MDKKEIKKNKLDLEYHGESQKANAFLILLTTGLLAFLGSFFFLEKSEFLILGIFITVIIFTLGSILYHKSLKRMRDILSEVESL